MIVVGVSIGGLPRESVGRTRESVAAGARHYEYVDVKALQPAGKQEDGAGGGWRHPVRTWPRAHIVDVSVSKIGVKPQPVIAALTGTDFGSQT